MCSAASLVAWILSLAVAHDGHGRPIPRPAGFATVIATVALEHPEVDPRIVAATLDVIAAHESAYRTSAIGDHGASCGAFQTPCARTPHDALGQARVAATIWLVAVDRCPEHPMWLYASGRCAPSRIARRYERFIREELSATRRMQ